MIHVVAASGFGDMRSPCIAIVIHKPRLHFGFAHVSAQSAVGRWARLPLNTVLLPL